MLFKPSIFKEAKKISLTTGEKLLIHEDLKAFMQAHPVRATEGAHQVDPKTTVSFWSSFSFMMLKPLPITLSALLLVGGGTAFAAENSLPNDVLYPIKIHVNERVRATLTPTSEGKAKWAAHVAERRLEEIEKLALAQKLEGQTQVQAETNFETQTKLVQEKITQLKAEGNVQAAVELSKSYQTTLQTHEAILTQLDAQNEDKTILDPLLEKMKLSATALSIGIQGLEGQKDLPPIKSEPTAPQDVPPTTESKGIDVKGTFTEKSIPPAQLDGSAKIDPSIVTQPTSTPPEPLKTDPLIPQAIPPDKAKLDLGL